MFQDQQSASKDQRWQHMQCLMEFLEIEMGKFNVAQLL
jgi:hypothetical protein